MWVNWQWAMKCYKCGAGMRAISTEDGVPLWDCGDCGTQLPRLPLDSQPTIEIEEGNWEKEMRSPRELLLKVVSDALDEFGDEALGKRVGPGDIEAWVDKWLKRESLVEEARKGYHEANHPVSSQYAPVEEA